MSFNESSWDCLLTHKKLRLGRNFAMDLLQLKQALTTSEGVKFHKSNGVCMTEVQKLQSLFSDLKKI